MYLTLLHIFCYYKKHSNNNNETSPLPLSWLILSTWVQLVKLNNNSVHSHFNTSIWWNLNEHYYYLISTESVICQIDANCSPFQSLNRISFHIRLEHLKLTCYSLIWIFFSYFFKTGTLSLLFLSSHVLATLQSGSNYFGILLWKIVKLLVHNETKPLIGIYSENKNKSDIIL